MEAEFSPNQTSSFAGGYWLHYFCTRGYRAHRTPGIPCALVGAEDVCKTSGALRGGS